MVDPGMWAVGTEYHRYIGRWSERVAARFLDWLALPPGLRWLDVGTGTGTLARCVEATQSPDAVLGIDSSEGFVGYAREASPAGTSSFEVGDALALPVPDGSFDAVVSGLVLNFLPDPSRGVGEMRRAVRSGGTVAAYVWDYGDGMQLIRRFWDAAVDLDPAAVELDEGRAFPLCRPAALGALFREAALERVETAVLEIDTVFRDFDDYWSPFLGGQGPAPAYAASLPEPR
jgi:SAM-dependent methyltransferase